MKPQVFDVYSPKILVAIMGLKDNRASHCIVIPMRWTDKKMPAFPPDFDGAEIRHPLYTLALTDFKSIYRNYFHYSELHKLHNRSGELWSPSIALAAFHENDTQVAGLLDAILVASEWYEQWSEGIALSDLEEAVLQSHEIMTRNADGAGWFKAPELREQVAKLLGQPVEQLGHALWIGHILTRLHLLDNSRRKRQMDGVIYAIEWDAVIDMMQRYDFVPISR